MSEQTPLSLDQQLGNRVRSWLKATGLTQRQLSKMIGCSDPSMLNGWLGGYKKLSARSTTKLVQLINMSRAQLEAKFTRNLAGRITSLQEMGKQIAHFDTGGWVCGQSGQDPDSSTDITGTNANPARTCPDDEELEFLAGLAGLHQAVVERTNDRQAKAKVNRDGATAPAKRITDDRKPGSRGDFLSVTPRQHLEYLQRERQKAEEDREIQRQINAERKQSLKGSDRVKRAEKRNVVLAVEVRCYGKELLSRPGAFPRAKQSSVGRALTHFCSVITTIVRAKRAWKHITGLEIVIMQHGDTIQFQWQGLRKLCRSLSGGYPHRTPITYPPPALKSTAARPSVYFSHDFYQGSAGVNTYTIDE
jgi:transcriptional regulator with XRE-family HTH domain